MPFEIGPAINISAVVALVVALVTHQLNTRREREAKRRELRIAYLMKSYRTLAKASENPKLRDMLLDLQEAIADIQFLGTLEQVSALQTVVNSFLNTKTADLVPLLIMLRDELRKEMGFKAIKGNNMWLRVDLTTPPRMPRVTEL